METVLLAGLLFTGYQLSNNKIHELKKTNINTRPRRMAHVQRLRKKRKT